jgi:hypothetical protein
MIYFKDDKIAILNNNNRIYLRNIESTSSLFITGNPRIYPLAEDPVINS